MEVVHLLLIYWFGAYVIHEAQGRQCACATGNVNIRSGPGTSYSKLGVLTKPTCLTYKEESVYAMSYNWAKVSYNSLDGWIADSWLNIITCASAANQCACGTNNVNIRSGAGTSNDVLGVLAIEECLPFMGNEIPSGGFNWAHLVYNGKDGFVASNYVSYSSCSSVCNTDTVPSGCPNIISRSQWGARTPAHPLTSMTAVPNNVYIHHGTGATCNTETACKSKVRGYQDHHMDNNGWDDIGYSFVIGEDGNVYEGRGWMMVGAHTSGHNTDGYGFSVIGDYSSWNPNNAAQTALRRLIQCGVDNGYLASNYVIQGHRDVVSTSCPGQSFYDLIRTWPHYKNSNC